MSDDPKVMVEHYSNLERGQILAMDVGRELDALVAEKVMGWKRGSVGWSDEITHWVAHIVCVHPIDEWKPSTDISAAWEVVEEMNGKYAFEIGRAGDYFDPRKWKARFGMSGYVEAETAPLAICRCALLAVMNL